MRVKAKPIDLSKLAGVKLKMRIREVGVELEGAWLNAHLGFIGDGSVSGLTPPAGKRFVHTGELPGTPIQPKELKDYLLRYYPDAVNYTCGMHVHMSFRNPAHYMRLMNPAYHATVVGEFIKWCKQFPERFPYDHFSEPNHHIWARLAGTNTYCRHEHYPDHQAQQAKKNYSSSDGPHRYTAICYPWARHRTIECRLLPMMPNAEEAFEAITHLLWITNAYLLITAKEKSQQKVEGSVVLPSLNITEHIVEAL